MNKILTIGVMICHVLLLNAQTFTGNITLSTQTQVNNFLSSGIKYDTITGNLTLDGNGNSGTDIDANGPNFITDLSNLSELVFIGGNLTIRDFNVAGNPTDLNALSVLNTIGNNFSLGVTNVNDYNSSLMTATLASLNSVSGSINIRNNQNLTSLIIPSEFTSGTGAVNLLDNADLTMVDLGIISTGGNFNLSNDNPMLSSLSMAFLQSIGGTLNISNTMITAIELPLLEAIDGNTTITNNTLLTDILIPTPFTMDSRSVNITGNTSLISLEFGIRFTSRSVNIQNNGTSVAGINLQYLSQVDSTLSFQNDAANAIITSNLVLSSLQKVGKNLTIVNACGVLTISDLDSVGQNLSYRFNGTSDFDFDFSSLGFVGGNLNVSNNGSLASCCIIPCKINIGGSVTVNANNGDCLNLITAETNCINNLAGPVSNGDIYECANSSIQTLTATASVDVDEEVIWYDAETGGNIVSPTLNMIDTVTFWAARKDTNTLCEGTERTPVTLGLNIASILSGGICYETVSDAQAFGDGIIHIYGNITETDISLSSTTTLIIHNGGSLFNNGVLKNCGTIQLAGGNFTNNGSYHGVGIFAGNFVNNGSISPGRCGS